MWTNIPPPDDVGKMSRQGHQEIDSRKHPEPGRLRVLTVLGIDEGGV